MQKKLDEVRREKAVLEKQQMSRAELEARLAALQKGPGDVDMSEALEEKEEEWTFTFMRTLMSFKNFDKYPSYWFHEHKYITDLCLTLPDCLVDWFTGWHWKSTLDGYIHVEKTLNPSLNFIIIIIFFSTSLIVF